MRRREFIALFCGVALAWPLAARAQQPAMPVIGFLSSESAESYERNVAGFRQGLTETGYVDGRNIALEFRWAEGQYDRLPGLAAELGRRKVAVIVTAGINAALAAKQATTTIPIVAVGIGDPLRTKLVASLARPGGNLTGNTILGAEIGGKRLELLREALSKISRVAFLWNPSNPANIVAFQDMQMAAGALGVELQSVEVSSPNQLESAFAAMTREHPDALIMTADPMHQLHVGRVVDFAAKNRLPSMHQVKENVILGGLMSYGASLPDLFRRGAHYVDRILKGAKPADLPVEQPTKFELAINLKAAKVLGLTIPPSLLARADEVIE